MPLFLRPIDSRLVLFVFLFSTLAVPATSLAGEKGKSLVYDIQEYDGGEILPELSDEDVDKWDWQSAADVESIALEQVDITNRSLRQFARFINTSKLSISSCDSVSDLSALRTLPNLFKINTGFTEVRDIRPLFDLKQLEEISVSHSKVSKKEVKRLEQAFPNADVSHAYD